MQNRYANQLLSIVVIEEVFLHHTIIGSLGFSKTEIKRIGVFVIIHPIRPFLDFQQMGDAGRIKFYCFFHSFRSLEILFGCRPSSCNSAFVWLPGFIFRIEAFRE